MIADAGKTNTYLVTAMDFENEIVIVYAGDSREDAFDAMYGGELLDRYELYRLV